MTGLRETLRRETRASHDRVDEAFGVLDLASREGLGDYLTAHARALPALEEILGAMPARRTALAADLGRLGLQFPPALTGHQGLKHPLGVAYVVGGSTMGARVLEKRWRRSCDSLVQDAHEFVTDVSLRGLWRRTQTDIENWQGSPSELQLIVASARWCFDLHLKALREETHV